MVRLSPAFASPAGSSHTSGPSGPSARTLGDEIAELAAQIHVATHRLLLKLRDFDAVHGWAGGGFRSTAARLSWRTGISPGAERKAEALGLLAEAALRAGVEVEGHRTTGRADRFQVMLHVSAETLAGPPAETPADASLACDASRVQVTHAPDGSLLDVGRRTRIVPPALRRALEVRDGGCAHPCCTNRICDAHHEVPWQDGGTTSLENLVLLCRRHHRAVHRGELDVEVRGGAGAPGGPGVVFRDAEGRELTAVPPLPALPEDPVAALRPDHAARGLDPVTLAALPRWDGTPLNLGFALDWLWRPGALAPPEASS